MRSRSLVHLLPFAFGLALALAPPAGAAHPRAAHPPAPPDAAAAAANDRRAILALLDHEIETARQAWQVPGLAVAIVQNGDVLLAKGYGVRALDGSEPVDTDTMFAIGSTTKAMTASLLGQLVAQGRLDWDDPVIRHLPAFRVGDPYVTRELTVRDLLTHRGGLPNVDSLWYGTDRTRDQLVAALANVQPGYSLRSSFVYQNLMYVTAGQLAATVAGASWEQLVVDRIFRPLGMSRTEPTLQRAQQKSNLAAPHAEVDGKLVRIENMPVDSAAPAGAVWSSVGDMSRWLRALLNVGRWQAIQVVPEAAVRELFRPQTMVPASEFYPTAELTRPHWTTYGFGFFQQDFQGRMVQFHTGSIDGMSALVGLVPDEGLGLVVLANRDHTEVRHALLWRILDALGPHPSGRDWLGETKALYDRQAQKARDAEAKELAQRVAGTHPTLPLARYAGTYRSPVYGEIEVRTSGDGLRLVVGPALQGALEPWSYDTFRVRWDRAWQGTALVSFALDETGTPSQLAIGGDGYHRIEQPTPPSTAQP